MTLDALDGVVVAPNSHKVTFERGGLGPRDNDCRGRGHAAPHASRRDRHVRALGFAFHPRDEGGATMVDTGRPQASRYRKCCTPHRRRGTRSRTQERTRARKKATPTTYGWTSIGRHRSRFFGRDLASPSRWRASISSSPAICSGSGNLSLEDLSEPQGATSELAPVLGSVATPGPWSGGHPRTHPR
jgi:hypothetical protein